MKTNNQTNDVSTSQTQTSSTKTGRKNKTRQELTVPSSGFYTIDDLCAKNPNFVEITLRVRLKKLVTEGKVAELGTLHMAKGRPKLVCATTPVSSETMTSARDAGVSFNEKYNVPVLNITDPTTTNSNVQVNVAPSTAVNA